MTSIHRITRNCAGAMVLLSLLLGAAPATQPQSHRFEKEILAYEAIDRKTPPPENPILFVGASGIRMWASLGKDFPNHTVMNRGFGGSQMADSVYYADRIVIPYKPKLIVIQAGGNDINAGKLPEQVLVDFKAFVEKVRGKLPETRIAFLSINASPSRWAQREKQMKANELVKTWIATQENMDYVDLWPTFLGEDGQPREDLFLKDRLHNNAEGYRLRAAAVRSHLP